MSIAAVFYESFNLSAILNHILDIATLVSVLSPEYLGSEDFEAATFFSSFFGASYLGAGAGATFGASCLV